MGRAGFGEHGSGRELGYTIRRGLRGRGLASEIAHALVQWHRENALAEPLRAYAAIENAASCRVLETVSFALEGSVEHTWSSGHALPLRLYPGDALPPVVEDRFNLASDARCPHPH